MAAPVGVHDVDLAVAVTVARKEDRRGRRIAIPTYPTDAVITRIGDIEIGAVGGYPFGKLESRRRAGAVSETKTSAPR